MESVSWHWSGKHHRVVKGINVVSLLWTDGDTHIPCDYGVYDKQEGRTKNKIFQDMLSRARSRGMVPSYLLFDSWYGSAENLRIVGLDYGWKFLTRFKANRQVRVTEKRYVAISTLTEGEHTVHLKDFGTIKVFVVTQYGETQYWATNDLAMDELTRLKYADCGWKIEEYHRGLKQYCNVEHCQHQSRVAQNTHRGLAIRAFLRLERYCYRTGFSWMQAKLQIVRDAVRTYMQNPSITFYSTA
jgi:putative transposase